MASVRGGGGGGGGGGDKSVRLLKSGHSFAQNQLIPKFLTLLKSHKKVEVYVFFRCVVNLNITCETAENGLAKNYG